LEEEDGKYVDPLPDLPVDDYVMCVQPGFADVFDAADARSKMIVGGQIKYKDGGDVYIAKPAGGGDFTAVPSTAEGAVPCFLKNDIVDIADRKPLEGYGWNKYQIHAGNIWDDFYNGAGNRMFDIITFRYAEVLLMQAECEFRLSGGGVAAFNQVRTRSWDSPATALSLQVIEDEYKREFALEDHRRTDMIRFGSYTKSTGKWPSGDIKNTADYTKLFPIPYLELAKNNNLQQNPGYSN
jgi:hypothetical protein